MKVATFLGGDGGYYRVDLQLHAEYEVVTPKKNDTPEIIRIIDESGEDYLYPRHWFEVKKK